MFLRAVVLLCLVTQLLCAADARVASASPGFGQVGGFRISLGVSVEQEPALAIHGGVTHVGMIEVQPGPGHERRQLVVNRLTPERGWQQVGGPLNEAGGNVIHPRLLSTGGVLYVTWLEGRWGAGLRLMMARLDARADGTARWERDSPGPAVDAGAAPQLIAVQGRPVVVYYAHREPVMAFSERVRWRYSRTDLLGPPDAWTIGVAGDEGEIYGLYRRTVHVVAHFTPNGNFVPERNVVILGLTRSRVGDDPPSPTARWEPLPYVSGARAAALFDQAGARPLLAVGREGAVAILDPGAGRVSPYTTLVTLPRLRVHQVVAVTRTADGIIAVVRDGGRLVLYRSHGPAGRATIETAPIPAHNLAPSDGFDVGLQVGPGGRPIIALQDGPRALVLDHTPDL